MNHTAKVINEKEFAPDSFKAKTIDEGITVIHGDLAKSGVKLISQRYEFDSEKFTVDRAKAWLKDNKISFTEFVEAVSENAPDDPTTLWDEAKAGARNSQSDLERMTKVHALAGEIQDHMKQLGVTAHPWSPYKAETEDGVPEEWT